MADSKFRMFLSKSKVEPSFLFLFVLGLVVSGIIISSNFQWRNRIQKNVPVYDNLLQARVSLTKGQLLLESILAGDQSIRIEDIWPFYDKADRSIKDCINGRSTISNMTGIPIKDDETLKLLQELGRTLKQFRGLALNRWNNRATKDLKNTLDERILFYQLERTIDSIEYRTLENIGQMMVEQKRIYSLTLVFWGGLFFSVFTILFITQAKRKKAESQLLKSHDKLEKRVKARTLALSTTNKNLKSEIHKKKIAQKKLMEERGQQISIFESIDELIYVSDLSTYEILYVNNALIKEFKKDPTGGICYKEFQHLDAPCSFCTNSKIIKQKYDPYTWEHHNTILKKDFIVTNRLIQWPGGRDVRFELAIDITSRKIAEEKVASSLKEKETLLYEIHHRVKNNLAVISSLLALQAIHMKDERLKDALNDSRNRIQAMAIIHETLHQSDNLAYIDMNSYLSNLATTVFANYSIGDRVNLEIDADKILMETDHASPVGLLINELISNSLKYAFPENQRGVISIQLKKSANDQIELIYADNGIGIPENINWEETDSLGLKLVKTIARDQLDGSIELKSDEGTCFIIKFERLQNKGH